MKLEIAPGIWILMIDSFYSTRKAVTELEMNQFNGIIANKNKGFSLIELLVVTAMVGILMAVAMPGFQDTVERATTNSQAKSLIATLNLARSEAIKRGTNVAICPSNDGLDCDGGEWSEGWMVFVDTNDDADGTSGSVDTGDPVIRVYDTLGSGSALTFTTNLFEYNAQGFNDLQAVHTFKICPSTNNANNARSIEISLSGRGRRIEDGLVCP